MGRVLTPRQAAELTGMGIIKILTLCNSGVIGVNTSRGKRPTWKIREEDLNAYLTPPSKQDSVGRSRIDSNVEKVF